MESASHEASSLGPSALAGRTAGGALPVVPHTRDTASLGRRRFKALTVYRDLYFKELYSMGVLSATLLKTVLHKARRRQRILRSWAGGCRASGTRKLL